MRTLSEILDGIKDNKQRPDDNEAYLSLLVMDQITMTLVRSVGELASLIINVHPLGQTILQETALLLETALGNSPEKYLGDYVPGNDKFDQDRKEFLEKIAKLKQEVLEAREKIERQIAEEEAKELKDKDKLN